jgi:hypothetical protein
LPPADDHTMRDSSSAWSSTRSAALAPCEAEWCAMAAAAEGGLNVDSGLESLGKTNRSREPTTQQGASLAEPNVRGSRLYLTATAASGLQSELSLRATTKSPARAVTEGCARQHTRELLHTHADLLRPCTLARKASTSAAEEPRADDGAPATTRLSSATPPALRRPPAWVALWRCWPRCVALRSRTSHDTSASPHNNPHPRPSAGLNLRARIACPPRTRVVCTLPFSALLAAAS